MKTTGNTILITGGGSGIGRGLAEAFHRLGNQVVIAGRRRDVLEAVTRANPGMKFRVVDVQDQDALKTFPIQLASDFPSLNVLINNAGIMRPENVLSNDGLDDAEALVTTNVLAPLRLTSALLPQLGQQARATIINVSSGLAFVPLAQTPTYSATKAFVHSYTESLRYQLRDTRIEVLELAPPYVATELLGPQQAADERAMPLPEFIAEVMDILKNQPDQVEILVDRVKPLRLATGAAYTEIFGELNAMFSPTAAVH